MPNPIFPLNEYVPDGEPHVFGSRVYLYGSHDAEGGDRFCERDYTVWSAPVDDLEHWICHGVSYRKEQDPRSKPGKRVDFYASDCVQGPDGRYYLYYVAMGPNTKNFGPMSVAVAAAPEGPFEYLGDIRWPDDRPMTQFLTNDPAVLNDNGRIWLYYGWGLGRDFRSRLLRPIYYFVLSKISGRPVSEIKAAKPSILSCAVVELEPDMVTVKTAPKAVLDSKTTAPKSSALYHHAFYEAPSIRKFGKLYYLIYSSGENCELAYATSQYPDRDFTYQGVIISNSDLGYRGNKRYKAAGGTIHGGVERIGNEYYVFYHRCTHNTNFSRQACAERISLAPNGSIPQVEMTTQGLAAKPLPAKGVWPATLCCNLYNARTANVQGNGHGQNRPNITHEGGEHFITAIDDGTVIGYKYLFFEEVSSITVTVRGASGQLLVLLEENSAPIANIPLHESANWAEYTISLAVPDGEHALFFRYEGKGKMDFLQFMLADIKYPLPHQKI